MDVELISKAAAIDYLMTNMGWRDEDGYEVDDADEKRAIIADLVNGIPSVNAIPVEWLKDKMQKPRMTCVNPFGFVLAEWLEEQEAR